MLMVHLVCESCKERAEANHSFYQKVKVADAYKKSWSADGPVLDAGEGGVVVAAVEAGFVNKNGADEEQVERVVWDGDGGFDAFESPADVGPVVGADQALRAVDELLSADAHGEIAIVVERQDDVGEGLLKVEVVDVAWTRSASAIEFEPAVELDEDAEVFSKGASTWARRRIR
jgi:hypothetical protein